MRAKDMNQSNWKKMEEQNLVGENTMANDDTSENRVDTEEIDP